MPSDNAERVIEGARHMSPNLGERIVATRIFDRSVFVREALPQDLKLAIDRIQLAEAIASARYLGGVIGRGHARQMEEGAKRSCQSELARNHSKTLDAPSWLWSSVVDLVASHERGYLEHCRRFAMGKAVE